MLFLFTATLDVKQGDDTMGTVSQRTKRRHARPHVLDSDDDEGKEENNTHKDEELILNEAVLTVLVDDDLLVNRK